MPGRRHRVSAHEVLIAAAGAAHDPGPTTRRRRPAVAAARTTRDGAGHGPTGAAGGPTRRLVRGQPIDIADVLAQVRQTPRLCANRATRRAASPAAAPTAARGDPDDAGSRASGPRPAIGTVVRGRYEVERGAHERALYDVPVRRWPHRAPSPRNRPPGPTGRCTAMPVPAPAARRCDRPHRRHRHRPVRAGTGGPASPGSGAWRSGPRSRDHSRGSSPARNVAISSV